MWRAAAKLRRMSNIRLPLSAVALPAVLASAALSLALLTRHFLIEPPEIGWACQAAAPPAWCALRSAVIDLVRAQIPGYLALAAGAFALWRGPGARRSRGAALTGVVAGAAGLAFYLPVPAAAGVLLGALALLREPA
jgi:hypothetical protein